MKKINRKFTSSLGFLINQHLKLYRSFGYLMNGAQHTLIRFDQYLTEYYPKDKIITRNIIINYLKTRSHLNSNSLHTELTHVRKFCRFLFSVTPMTYIPERNLIAPARRKVVPYIYTMEDILKLLSCAKNLGPENSLRPHTYVTLIGLLWVSGLRISEALRLNLEDIDYDQEILMIKKTKFAKSRIVPISSSTVNALKTYQQKRSKYGHDQKAQAPFFVNERSHRCEQIGIAFRQLLKQAGLKTPQGTTPRIHDLRHSFATHRLSEFYKDGKDAGAHLPILATYLGHVNINCTQVYLHPSLDLLARAGLRFRKHILNH